MDACFQKRIFVIFVKIRYSLFRFRIQSILLEALFMAYCDFMKFNQIYYSTYFYYRIIIYYYYLFTRTKLIVKVSLYLSSYMFQAYMCNVTQDRLQYTEGTFKRHINIRCSKPLALSKTIQIQSEYIGFPTSRTTHPNNIHPLFPHFDRSSLSIGRQECSHRRDKGFAETQWSPK